MTFCAVICFLYIMTSPVSDSPARPPEGAGRFVVTDSYYRIADYLLKVA